MNYPKKVTVIELENAPFKGAKPAYEWATSHGIVGLMSDIDTGGKGEVSISNASILKMVSGSAATKSITPEIHFAALMRLRDIIRESFVGEIHADYGKVNGKRSTENKVNPNVSIVRLYGCVSLGGIMYRAKTTLKRYVDPNEKTKAYSYEISNIEVLKGVAGFVTRPSDKTSMDVDILLNGVCDVNGEPLLKNEDRRHQSPRSPGAHAARSAGRKR